MGLREFYQQQRTCKTCMHFRTIGDDPDGMCTANPPVLNGSLHRPLDSCDLEDGVWPWVKEHDGCGKHEDVRDDD